MKLVVVLALIAGCGGSTKPEPAKNPKPDVESSPAPASDDKQAVLAAGFNEEGVKAMYAGKYELASEQFRNAVARVPEPKYFFNLCTSLFQEGKFADAKVSCEAIDKVDPPPAAALVEKAHKLVAKIEAEAKAQGVSTTMTGGDLGPPPDSTPAPNAGGGQAAIAAKHNDEGIQLMYAQKYAEASAKFRDAVARVPEPRYFFNLCTSLFQEGKFSEALTSCNAVAKNNPTPELQTKTKKMIDKIQGEAKAQGVPIVGPGGSTPSPTPTASGGQAAIAAKLSDEGVQLMFTQKYAEASAKFREAVARVPEAKYFFNLCTSLFQEGKFSEALTSCNAVAKNNPTPALQTKANKLIDKIQAEAKAQGVSVQSP